MQLDERLKTFKVMFGLPTIDGKVDVHYLHSMVNTRALLDRYGIQSDIAVIPRDIYIQRARNDLAKMLLKSDFTHLFFIDADMGWEAEKVVKLLAREKDVIFGTYVFKRDDQRLYTHQSYKVDGEVVQENGLIRCNYGPTGFMCIRREVFEKMRDKYPNLLYDFDGKKYWAFFQCSINNGVLNGEDIDFCHKWTSMGGEIWCEPDCGFVHSGIKFWTCNYNEDLKILNQPKTDPALLKFGLKHKEA